MPTAISLMTITHVIATDGTYTVTCRNSSGTAQDISGGTLEMDVKAYPGASTSTTTEATVTTTGSAAGVATLTFDETDLASATPGIYVFYVTHTLSGTTTSYGPFTLILKPKGN